MKVEAKIYPEVSEGMRWSPEGVASLIGQRPILRGFGTTHATIVDARIEDGWVVVTLEENP